MNPSRKVGLVRLAAAAVFALTGAALANADTSGLALGIRFFDKKVFYLSGGPEDADPILVQVSVTNNAPEAFRFRLADDRAFSVDFEVRETTSRLVPYTEALVRKRSDSRRVFFREVTIESGETFSFVEDLSAYVAIPQIGAYLVEAKLYPDLIQATAPAESPARLAALLGREEAAAPLSHNAQVSAPGGSASGSPVVSNRLSLRVRPRGLAGSDGIPVALDQETGANLVREKLPPDEVVRYMLSSRQKAQWEKFFLYLDLEAMLSRDAARQRQWRAESEEGRLRLLARYREEIQSQDADGEVSGVPTEFQIERTTYNAAEGTVTVLEKFKAGGYTERKRYTYYLRLRDGVWVIVDYSVVNLGIE